jgi:hypothetical protein
MSGERATELGDNRDVKRRPASKKAVASSSVTAIVTTA